MAVSDNAATFLGISNENEFYSAHYLSEVFKGDIKETLDTWTNKAEQDEHYQPPFKCLNNLNREYFAMRERLQRERSAKQRTQMQRDFFKSLLAALDIPWAPANVIVGKDQELPVLSRLPADSEQNKLWVLGALDIDNEGIDPLALKLHKDQFIGDGPQFDSLKNTEWYELLNNVIFKLDEPPRWVLLLSDSQLILIDRYKWLQNRMLRFDWGEILGRRDDLTLKATAALLHTNSLVPEQGESLLDGLDENSHKHAFGVSEDLKYALREAIELLGNQAAEQLIQRKEIGYTGKSALDADQLSRECLRYMYRLLFLFYIEARPELGYVPHQADVWRKGYSLESLRDLEMVRLHSEESLNGHYLHHSIQKMFKLIHEGYDGTDPTKAGLEGQFQNKTVQNSFIIERLDSHLFDPARTPYLNKVKFTNQALQRVIKLMSLTRKTSGRGRKRRGRVSYAQLGINQLGAVYEALLSYRGFFATQDLYEVKKAGTSPDELEAGFFVTADQIGDYKEDEKVFDHDEECRKKLRIHPRGKFIYRLAGRDREKSASYYTPEILTRTLVKYTLKERLKDVSADEILNLTVCEPAMGSAAFLNEAVNQLAEAYLTRKQKELDQRIPHDEYRQALQHVKMHIADHNVYGVDLNPIAVELAEVSLWLNALSGSSAVPWFGYQLFNGNSLIGARRQVYRSDQLLAKKKDQLWYNSAPKRLEPSEGAKRNEHELHHFLLPDPGMVNVQDKEAKKLKPDTFKKIQAWKKEFLKPLDRDEVEQLQFLSDAIDKLWAEHTQLLRNDRKRTEDIFPIWGQNVEEYHTSTAEKDRIRASGIFNNNARIASNYRRLKLVMDYWCALWFWPLEKVDLLPRRDEWFRELTLLLTDSMVFNFGQEQSGFNFDAIDDKAAESPKAQDLFADQHDASLSEYEQKAREVKTAQGELNLEKLFKQFERLRLVNDIASQEGFFHWELVYSDVFLDKGGFDIVLGNPPWRKVEWSEKDIFSDYEPKVIIKAKNSVDLNEIREAIVENNASSNKYWSELVSISGARVFFNSIANYQKLGGAKANLYKCFIPVSWMLLNKSGKVGLLHPENIYEDPDGNYFRGEIFKRLIAHFQFQNEKKLFPIGNRNKFSINIYGQNSLEPRFITVSNLFSNTTLDQCFNEVNVKRTVPSLKDEKGRWELEGHPDRVIVVGFDELKLFSELNDVKGTPAIQARLPAIHAKQVLSVLSKLAKHPRKLSDISDRWFSTGMWNETYSKEEGLLIRNTSFPISSEGLIYSGPHFQVGNPFFQTPKRICETHRAYDNLDLTELYDGYLPRTNYVPSDDLRWYFSRIPQVAFDGDVKPVTKYYRFINREMVGSFLERTLISTIIPPEYSHLKSCVSVAFDDNFFLLDFAAASFSIVSDFFVKNTGLAHVNVSLLKQLPLVQEERVEAPCLRIRALMLCCLTNEYANLWETCWDDVYCKDSLTNNHENIIGDIFSGLNGAWAKEYSARSDLLRRQLLVEIDVLMAMNIGLTLNEFLAIYRIQFPAMQQYDKETWYDRNGRIVYTTSMGLSGVGLDRKAKKDQLYTIETSNGQTEEKPLGWEDATHLPEGTKIYRTIIDDTQPGGPREKTIIYQAPWYLPNREEDYRVAWGVFSERFGVSDSDNEEVVVPEHIYPGGRVAAEVYLTLILITVQKQEKISQNQLRTIIGLSLDSDKREL